MSERFLLDLQRSIEADLDWRQSELAIFRELLTSVTQQNARRRALFRAAWTLLYAHYEGFVKYCLELYTEFVSKTLKSCSGLPDKTFVFLIEKQINRAKSMAAEDIFVFFQTEVQSMRHRAPLQITIDTKSNLWPHLLKEILMKLDLHAYGVLGEERKLQTLVARRNDIAHGKKVFIDEIGYYLEYESAVTDLMYNLAIAVVEKSERVSEPSNLGN